MQGEQHFFFLTCLNHTDSIRLVPADRLLIESDWNDCTPHAEAMIKILSIVSDVRGWSLQEAATKTTESALAFFGLK